MKSGPLLPSGHNRRCLLEKLGRIHALSGKGASALKHRLHASPQGVVQFLDVDTLLYLADVDLERELPLHRVPVNQLVGTQLQEEHECTVRVHTSREPVADVDSVVPADIPTRDIRLREPGSVRGTHNVLRTRRPELLIHLQAQTEHAPQSFSQHILCRLDLRVERAHQFLDAPASNHRSFLLALPHGR